MSDYIAPNATTIDYVDIEQAREMDGLRLILGAYAIPGPWREACKGLFHVKRLAYVAVKTSDRGQDDLHMGMSGSASVLREWTGQESQPVAVWNDERPRAGWLEQIMLAERLEPSPPLVPDEVDDRARMFGLVNELAGENGFGWSCRLAVVHGGMSATRPGDDRRAFFEHLGNKYGYTPAAGEAAPARAAAILRALDRQLSAQHKRGARYLIGDRLSALDIYWATFATLLAPLSPELCPMGTDFRDGVYGNPYPETQAALSKELLAHRDLIYEQHLELPIVF